MILLNTHSKMNVVSLCYNAKKGYTLSLKVKDVKISKVSHSALEVFQFFEISYRDGSFVTNNLMNKKVGMVYLKHKEALISALGLKL
jgi:hypothetical protein